MAMLSVWRDSSVLVTNLLNFERYYFGFVSQRIELNATTTETFANKVWAYKLRTSRAS